MNSVCKYIPIVLIVLAFARPSLKAENKTDRWFSADKFQHFGYSAFFSGGSYTVAHRHFENGTEDSFIIGVGFTISLGAAKEYIDKGRPGQTSSYKDFAWDIAGALTGAIIASLAQ